MPQYNSEEAGCCHDEHDYSLTKECEINLTGKPLIITPYSTEVPELALDVKTVLREFNLAVSFFMK